MKKIGVYPHYGHVTLNTFRFSVSSILLTTGEYEQKSVVLTGK